MKYETTLVRHLFPLIVLSSAVTITAFAQSDISGPAPAIVAGDLDAELGELDAETRRFQAEVARLDVRDNVRRTWVYAFKISTPENRANIWQELEQARQQPDADLSAIIAEAAAGMPAPTTMTRKPAATRPPSRGPAIRRPRSTDWLRFSPPPRP
jgi:hypothetical protein